MKHSIHCDQQQGTSTKVQLHFPLARTVCQPRPALALQYQLSPGMDYSTHTFVQRRRLAQKLLERPPAAKAVMESLSSNRNDRSAALIVLQHCCKLNSQLSQYYVKAGLIRKLFSIATSSEAKPVEKVQSNNSMHLYLVLLSASVAYGTMLYCLCTEHVPPCIHWCPLMHPDTTTH
jgi:hypothetical protein